MIHHRTSPTHRAGILVSTLLSAAFTTAANAQNYTLTGPGCPGSNGLVPSLTSTMQPQLNTAFTATLGNAAPGALAAFFGLGFANPGTLLPLAPGCFQRTSADDVQLAFLVGGSASTTLTIPADPLFVGLELFQQGFVLDSGANALGVVASDGRQLTIDLANPVINSISAPVVTAGGTLTLRGRNLRGLGTGGGNCLRIMNNGRSVLFRTEAIVIDPATGEDVVTARAPVVAAPFAGVLQVMTGEGRTPVIQGDPWLSAPRDAYAWGGRVAVGQGGAVTVNPSPRQTIAGAVTQRQDGCVVITIPVDPCSNGGVYPANAEINLDFHGFYVCNGRSSDFDLFGIRVNNIPFGVFCQNVAFAIKNQLQTLLGPDFTVTQNPNNLCEILVCPVPGCVFNMGWGNLVIQC